MPHDTRPHRRFLLWALLPYGLFWLLMAYQPKHFSDWLLENALVVPAVGFLLWSAWKFPLSRVSYTLILIFLSLHALGAHYTYSEVPYQEWFPWLAGGRNQFDRLVHFSFGLLLAYPIRELFLRVAKVKGVWGYYLPLDVTMAFSGLYEIIEWGAAEFFGGDLGVAYLGTQGDVWDAQKDMALATLGAFLAMLLTAALNARFQRDFARDLADSLQPDPTPLGEDEIARMRQEE